MNLPPRGFSGSESNRLGFTLIELLVVIAIIAVLASLLLPTLAYAKKATKIKTARVEMTHLLVAIEQYEAEYNRMPLSKEALASTTASCPDFTCGTVQRDGTTIAKCSVINTGGSGYENVNSEVISILRATDTTPNENHAYNPRRIAFLQARETGGTSPGGVGSDGVFRDPWGNPYVITLDVSQDGECQDGFYYYLTKAASVVKGRGSATIWSLGPDGDATIDRQVGPKTGVNADNILSWQ